VTDLKSMAKVALYNNQGKESGSLDLNDDVFGVKSKMAVIHQVYNALMSNLREPWAHSKNKGEVRGGGKKPWRQKGTGRARHGSIRSPIWRGGGVTFGPLNTRNYKQKINKKMNKQAVRMCLSDKILESKFFAIEDLINEDGKTKSMAKLRLALPGSGRTTLLLVSKQDEMLKRSTRNLPKFNLQLASDVNVVDLLHNQYVFATKSAIEALENRLKK
jgi:large subunit ribosomal protein L4